MGRVSGTHFLLRRANPFRPCRTRTRPASHPHAEGRLALSNLGGAFKRSKSLMWFDLPDSGEDNGVTLRLHGTEAKRPLLAFLMRQSLRSRRMEQWHAIRSTASDGYQTTARRIKSTGDHSASPSPTGPSLQKSTERGGYDSRSESDTRRKRTPASAKGK